MDPQQHREQRIRVWPTRTLTAQSQASGAGTTYFMHIEEDELAVAELVIPEDVNLYNLEKVIVPISLVREVDALGVLDQYKKIDSAPELNIQETYL